MYISRPNKGSGEVSIYYIGGIIDSSTKNNCISCHDNIFLLLTANTEDVSNKMIYKEENITQNYVEGDIIREYNKKLYTNASKHVNYNNTDINNIINTNNNVIDNIEVNTFDNLIKKVNKVEIHCAGKVGEILAATSIAKYISINYPDKFITWNCSKLYKHVLSFCPYIDNVVCFDDNAVYKNIRDLKISCNNNFLYLCKQNSPTFIKNNVLHINAYYNYLYLNNSKIINKKPFNEQFFDTIGKQYSLEYCPDIIYYSKYEAEAEMLCSKYGNIVLLFPFGHDVSKLSFNINDYSLLSNMLKDIGVTLIITGNSKDYDVRFNNVINIFGLDLGVIFSLFRKSVATIGVNSGIVFSSLFLYCPIIIMEDERNISMWNLNNIKKTELSRTFCFRKLNVKNIVNIIKNDM